MRGITLAVTIGTLILLAGCLAPAAAPDDGPVDTAAIAPAEGMGGSMHEGTTIRMAEDMFHPMHMDARVGEPVTWVNDDAYMHTVTSNGLEGPLESGPIDGFGSWTYTFDAPGTFEYHCEPHAWDAGSGYEGMVATIRVIP